MDPNGVITGYTITYTIEGDSEISLKVPFNKQNVMYIHCMITQWLCTVCANDVGTILQYYWTESIPTDHSDHYCY